MSARWGACRPTVWTLAVAVIAVPLEGTPAASAGEAVPAVAVVSTGPAPANVVLIDDFSDGEFSLNPPWNDVRPAWGVVGGELWSSDFNQQVITTPRTDVTGTWTFRFRLQA